MILIFCAIYHIGEHTREATGTMLSSRRRGRRLWSRIIAADIPHTNHSCVLEHGCLIQGVFFTGTPLKSSKYILARLGVSRLIYVNVDSPNLGFPYFKLFRGVPVKKTPCILAWIIRLSSTMNRKSVVKNMEMHLLYRSTLLFSTVLY